MLFLFKVLHREEYRVIEREREKDIQMQLQIKMKRREREGKKKIQLKKTRKREPIVERYRERSKKFERRD